MANATQQRGPTGHVVLPRASERHGARAPQGRSETPSTNQRPATGAMAAPVVDASWERVDAFESPPMEQEGGWELIEDTSELVVLDLAQADGASSQAPTTPGTDVVLTVCVAD